MSNAVDLMNRIAEHWGHAQWQVAWQSAVLAAIVWLLTRGLGKAPAALRFWLWMLVPFRLAVMPLLTVTLPLLPAPPPNQIGLNHATLPPVPAIASALPVTAEAPGAGVVFSPIKPAPVRARVATPAVAPVASPTLSSWLLAAWSIGVALSGARLAMGWHRVCRIAANAAPLGDAKLLEAAHEAAARMGLRRLPRIVVTDQNISPLVMGVFRPIVVLPRLLAGSVSEELVAVLAHEFAHIRRGDTLTGWLLGICQMFYFFHPAFHLARWQSMREREQACDECVVDLGRTNPGVYARVLIAAAEACRGLSSRIAPSAVVAESFADLKRRVSLICSAQPPRARLSKLSVAGLCLFAAVALPGIVITARKAGAAAPAADAPLDRFVTVDVTDAQGLPVVGASIEAIADFQPAGRARTDERGRATLELAPESHIQWIIALKAKVGFDYFESDKGPSQPPLAKDLPDRIGLVLDGARTVSIHALDSQKSNVAAVRFVPWILHKKNRPGYVNLSGSTLAGVPTDEKGIAAFDWLPATAASASKEEFGVTFLVQSDRYDWPDPPKQVRYSDDGRELIAELTRNGQIMGKVIGADGKPTGGIRIEAEGRGMTEHFCRTETRSRADGSYRLSVSAGQSYLVAVADTNWTAANQTRIKVGEDQVWKDIDFRLNKGTLLTGQITGGDERQPLAGQVVFVRYDHALVRQTWTNAEGNYAFRVPPGKYDVGSVGIRSGPANVGLEPNVEFGNRGGNGDACHDSKGGPYTVTVNAESEISVDFERRSNRASGTAGSIVKANYGKPFEYATLRMELISQREWSGGERCMPCHRPHIP